MAILFYIEPPLKYKLINRNVLKKWLTEVAQEENHRMASLNYILCTDEYLYQINANHLQHYTYTDVITFDNSDETNCIEGDIFISVERVVENAQAFNTTPEEELRRVMVHGLLHLLGYKDKTKTDQAQMRQKEGIWLARYDELQSK